ncbi:MAG: hypothetical protein HZA92_02130 [Verrucomicrobia bacterium]|nr:hypothetical protein [Verrucomicrobiota bacterium]
MSARTILLYLSGHAGAIHDAAQSRAAFVTGLVLVLLTTIPRNYDQTFIGDDVLRWVFASLLFSLVSGTWLYGVAYGWLARWRMGVEDRTEAEFFAGWRCFMGLFWLTAPIAWLYALPVERFLDSVSATQVNVALLGVVSLWRVLLMGRVLQVLCGAPFYAALMWVLLAAGVEVFVVGIFSPAFSKSIMSAMGGMRNSPEEEILLVALNTAMGAALYGTPLALLAVFLIRPKGVRGLPVQQPARVPVSLLVGLAVAWGAVACGPQMEVARTAKARRLVESGKYREAVDYLAGQQPGDFAPAVPLPPKTFERATFEQLPGVIGVLQPTDPAWVRQVMFKKLDEMVAHSGHKHGAPRDQHDRVKFIEWVEHGSWVYSAKPEGFVTMLDGLVRLPEGQEWLRRNELYLQGLKAAAMAERRAQEPGWKLLAGRVETALGGLPTSPPKP